MIHRVAVVQVRSGVVIAEVGRLQGAAAAVGGGREAVVEIGGVVVVVRVAHRIVDDRRGRRGGGRGADRVVHQVGLFARLI